MYVISLKSVIWIYFWFCFGRHHKINHWQIEMENVNEYGPNTQEGVWPWNSLNERRRNWIFVWRFIFSKGLNYRLGRRAHELKNNKLLGIRTTFTSLVLQISIAIHLRNLVFVVKVYFILDLDKELHEVIACNVVPFPIVHSFFDHASKVFWNFGVYRS